MKYRHGSSLRRHLKFHREMKSKYKELSLPRLVSIKKKWQGNTKSINNSVSKFENLLSGNLGVNVKPTEKTKLFVIDESDPNMWVLGSEETHNLHQTVFESLARSGHDYTGGEDEYDNDNFLPTATGMKSDTGSMPKDSQQRSVNESDDLHNYALCSENTSWDSANNGLFPEVACLGVPSATHGYESFSTDHESYSSIKYT